MSIEPIPIFKVPESEEKLPLKKKRQRSEVNLESITTQIQQVGRTTLKSRHVTQSFAGTLPTSDIARKILLDLSSSPLMNCLASAICRPSDNFLNSVRMSLASIDEQTLDKKYRSLHRTLSMLATAFPADETLVQTILLPLIENIMRGSNQGFSILKAETLSAQILFILDHDKQPLSTISGDIAQGIAKKVDELMQQEKSSFNELYRSYSDTKLYEPANLRICLYPQFITRLLLRPDGTLNLALVSTIKKSVLRPSGTRDEVEKYVALVLRAFQANEKLASIIESIQAPAEHTDSSYIEADKQYSLSDPTIRELLKKLFPSHQEPYEAYPEIALLGILFPQETKNLMLHFADTNWAVQIGENCLRRDFCFIYNPFQREWDVVDVPESGDTMDGNKILARKAEETFSMQVFPEIETLSAQIEMAERKLTKRKEMKKAKE